MSGRVDHWRVQKEAAAGAGVVTAQHWAAASAGAEILAAGGNAVDAAVATAMALNAVEPWMSGIGGSGMMLVYTASEDRAHGIEFQGAAPKAIDPESYPIDGAAPPVLMGYPAVIDQGNVRGYGAINVPGAVAGLSLALARFGTIGWDRVLAPAIDLAEAGLPVDWHAMLNIAHGAADLARDPGAAAVYLPGGHPPPAETRLPLGNLPGTLRILADDGPDAFYRGAIAERMVDDLGTGGSVIAADDLADYAPRLFDPVVADYRGWTLYLTGDECGGTRMADALTRLADRLDPAGGLDADAYVAWAESLDGAFIARQERQAGGGDGEARPGASTTHVNVVDRDGNAVALTYTLLNRFGARVVLPATGVLMNNGISYFDPRPGKPDSLVGGRKVRTSNMCPTVVARDGQMRFLVGASGGNHIVPAVFCVTSMLLDFGLDMVEALHRPRIDAAGREDVQVDIDLPAAAVAALEKRGPVTRAERTVLPKPFASPSAVERRPEGGAALGMADVYSPIAAAVAAP